MATQVIYKNPRPRLAIHLLYTRNDGKSCEITFFKVESWFRLNRESITRLRGAYLIGGGQEWCVRSQCDGLEEPAGIDIVSAVEINEHGEIINKKPIHSYTGQTYTPIEIPYYSYIIEDMCDSSD